MPAQIIGNQATAVELYIAFNGAAPSNPIYNNYLSVLGSSSAVAFADTLGDTFASVSDATLAATVLANLGISAATTNDAAFAALSTALPQLYAAYPGQRGIVTLNLLNILTTLEGNATYGVAAAAFNNTTANAFVYASNTANLSPGPLQSVLPGGNFTLTTGIDAIVGTAVNDTINAPTVAGADTFTALDSINGGDGTDTFNLVSATGSLAGAAGATVSNVEIVNLTAAAAITAADVSGFTGVTTLNVVSGAAIAGVKASATTNINVANGLAAVAVDGGKNVTVKSSGGSITVGGATAAAGDVSATDTFSTGTIAITAAGAETAVAKKGGITFNGGTSINATASSAVSEADIAAHAAAKTAADAAAVKAGGNTDTSGKAKVTAANVVTDLATLATAIAAATNYSADATTVLSIEAATVAAVAAKAISVADKVAIDAAFIAGLATSTLAARTAAQAVVTPLQTAAATASTAATAADALNDAAVTAAQTAAAAVVAADTAAGVNVAAVSVTATTNTALASATVTGNYGSTNTITDASTLNNTLTSVTLNNAGDSTLRGLALTNVSATGMHGNVTVTNGTAAHTETFTLSAITAGTYTDDNATTVNVVSNGSATNKLTGLHASVATAVNLSGAAGLTFGTTTFAAAAVIDASQSSGSNKITVGSGQTYTGGSGADTVTTNGGTLQAKTVDGGAGSADKLILAANADFATTGAAKFANFEIAQISNGVTADLSKFTNSAFTSVVLDGATTEADGLNATQAANITIDQDTTATIGVTGATIVGQLDTVGITVSDGLAAVNTITLTAPTLGGVETLNLTATDNITIDTLINATALTNVNVTGAGDVSITSGALALNVNTIIDASAVTGGVTLDLSLATANGVALKAGNGANALTGTDLAGKGNSIVSGDGNSTITGGQANDVITAGNGNNTIHGAAGANTITVGNGNNIIDNVGSAGANKVTAGNGYNVITGGSGIDTIAVGTGGDLITGAAGADKITFGAHVAGVTDGLVYAAAIGDSGDMILANGALTSVDVITGMQAGDTINTSIATVVTITNAIAGTFTAATTANNAYTIRGDYVASTGAFTASATGHDTLVEWNDATGGDVATHAEAIVLVGYADAAATHIAGGLITLG